MKKRTVYHYDAFTHLPGKGNAAGVVLDADEFSPQKMQEIAAQVGFNETAFLTRSDNADLRMRYFTPGKEMVLCGHATIASVCCLYHQGKIPQEGSLTVETNAGVLGLTTRLEDGQLLVTMEQSPPQFLPYKGDLEALAGVLGILPSEIDQSLPLVYGNTGTWTLLLPINGLDVFGRMRPQNHLFPTVLEQLPTASIHPFCLQSFAPGRATHSRHFSAAGTGVTEDSVTGTAAGALGGYYATYLEPNSPSLSLKMEQGQELGKDGEVLVTLKWQGQSLTVQIAGTAVLTSEFLL